MPPANDKIDAGLAAPPEDRVMDQYARRLFQRRRRALRAGVFVTAFAVIVWLITPGFFWRPWVVETGQPARREIRAPIAFDAIDREATQRLRDEESRRFPVIYQYDSAVLDEARAALRQLVQAAVEIAQRELPPTIDAATIEGIRLQRFAEAASSLGLAGLALPDQRTVLGWTLHFARDPAFADSVGALLEEIYLRRGVVVNKGLFRVHMEQTSNSLRALHDRPYQDPFDPLLPLDLHRDVGQMVRSRAPQYAPPEMPGADSYLAALQAVTLGLARRPNITLQVELTNQLREQRLRALQPVMIHVDKGAPLVRLNDVVSPRQAGLIEALNAAIRRTHRRQLLANAVFTLLVIWFVIFYVRRFHPELGLTASSLWLILLPTLVGLGFGRAALIAIPDPPYHDVAQFLFPAGMVGILGLMLLDARMAMILVVVSSLLFGLAVDMRMEYVLTAIAGGIAGVAGLYRMRERKDFVLAGLLIAGVNVVCIGASIYLGERAPELARGLAAYQPLMAGGLNGLICVPLVYYLPVFFERIFGVVTDLRLLELTSRHPLLERMEREAPGTYQHSLNVAKLAETAADAIGANFLLVRAGALFHDIGKIAKREYFTENQVTPEETNIHSRLTPNMSTLLIKNHVKEGIDLARKAGLPPRVIDFIPMHHGTTIITYFYNQALKQYEESGSRDPVLEDEFRYPGPKPQTPETAIVMMADSVEATAHSVLTGRRVDVDEIRRVVLESVRSRFTDGQFDECHLTLRDLHLISESFVQSLRARYHRRVAYKKQ